VCTPLANVTIDAYIAHTLAPQILARTYTAQRFLVVGAGAAALPAAASLINHAGPAVTLAIAAAAITAAAITALLLQPHPALHIHVHHRQVQLRNAYLGARLRPAKERVGVAMPDRRTG
jgi:thioredoxin reductase